MSAFTRRQTMALLASGPALGWAGGGAAETPAGAALATEGIAAIDAACRPILSQLPEAAVTAGLPEAAPGGPLSGKCNSWSPDGNAAIALAIKAAQGALPAGDGSAATAEVRSLLDSAARTSDIRYGRNNPLGATHRPYSVCAYAGLHLSTPTSLRLVQRTDSPEAVDAWLRRLDAYADALLGAAQSVRADEAAGCVPPALVSRAALPQMDAFLLARPDEHPLVLALGQRTTTLDPQARAQALAHAGTILAKRVQPSMALLRDTVAAITRRGRTDVGLWAQPQGDRLHAANFARAGDTSMDLADAQAFGRAEATRIADLLDRRLAARGLRKGTIADRIATAFSSHPEFIEADDEGGRASLLQTAQIRLDAGRASLQRFVPAALAETQPLQLLGLPEAGKDSLGGSFYLPAAIDGARPATLWLDTRSVHALPTPGISPIAYHLGIPGLHLLASSGRIASAPRSVIARIAAFPAMTEGWGCYAERLAAENGLFTRDPWGDIARLSDELLRAARLVVDIGIHAQRWPREQAQAEMQAMTGAPQTAAIDRIIALPGEAASQTIGLHHLLDLRDKTRAAVGRRFDEKAFHGMVLAGGARPFALVAKSVAV